VPPYTKINVCHALKADWTLHAYLYRMAYVSISNQAGQKFYLTSQDCRISKKGYTKVNDGKNFFNLQIRDE
jgi:hypothetical protein